MSDLGAARGRAGEPRVTSAVFERIDEAVSGILTAARIPGAGLAVVAHGETVYAKGYGSRDVARQLPTTADTAFPIGSTTKGLTATIIGTIVDEGKLLWDRPVQTYVPGFRLWDAAVSAQVTLRDLLSMRVGLPRHDWVWIDNPITLECIVNSLSHLGPSCGFRERFQYNNLTYLAAAFIAEAVSGRTWSEMVGDRILAPLGMRATACDPPVNDDVTLSYHENVERQLLPTRPIFSASAAAAGGAIYSTVRDMARWVECNLSLHNVHQRMPIRQETVTEIQSPSISSRGDGTSPTPHAAYGMGWFIDSYNGHSRISHGGYLNDVHSDIALHPEDEIGLVCYTNFGAPRLARFVNQQVFDILLGADLDRSFDAELSRYEQKIEGNRARLESARHVSNTQPSHALEEYAGYYRHPAYGGVEVATRGGELTLRLRSFTLPLEHWHYDSWIVASCDFVAIHAPHPLDRASQIGFETDPDGIVAAVIIRLEPCVAPIRFERVQ